MYVWFMDCSLDAKDKVVDVLKAGHSIIGRYIKFPFYVGYSHACPHNVNMANVRNMLIKH